MPTHQQIADTRRRAELGIALCSCCKQERPVSDFEADKRRRPYGLSSSCRDCSRARKLKSQKKNRKLKPAAYRARDRERRLRRFFGVTVEQYDQMLASQSGLCAICRQPETDVHSANGKVQNLAIDHNRKTGEVRSLLCARCNKGLGLFREQPKLLIQAAEYLRRHNGRAYGLPVLIAVFEEVPLKTTLEAHDA